MPGIWDNSAFSSTLRHLPYFALQFSGAAYVPSLIALAGGFCLFGLMAALHLVHGLGFELCCFYLGDVLLFGVLYIPLLETCLQIFLCRMDDLTGSSFLWRNDQVQCWTPVHVGELIWNCFTLKFMSYQVFVFSQASRCYFYSLGPLLLHLSKTQQEIRKISSDTAENQDSLTRRYKHRGLCLLTVCHY